uniref:Uncharacterized protein n=1 Tax=Lepeophtheirus salmonis TaxID=72036 RepID=A0A0K2TD65_LEPSM
MQKQPIPTVFNPETDPKINNRTILIYRMKSIGNIFCVNINTSSIGLGRVVLLRLYPELGPFECIALSTDDNMRDSTMKKETIMNIIPKVISKGRIQRSSRFKKERAFCSNT